MLIKKKKLHPTEDEAEFKGNPNEGAIITVVRACELEEGETPSSAWVSPRKQSAGLFSHPILRLIQAKEFRALRGAPGALPLDPTIF